MKYWLYILPLLIFSCKTQEITTTTNDSFRFVERELRDTTLPGFTLSTEISLPEITELRIYDTITVVDPQTKGMLKLWKDRYGVLNASCESQSKTIAKLQERIKEFQSTKSEKIIAVDNRNWWQKLTGLIPWYGWVIVGAILVVILKHVVL